MSDLPPKESKDVKQKKQESIKQHVQIDRTEKQRETVKENTRYKEQTSNSWASVVTQQTIDFIETEKVTPKVVAVKKRAPVEPQVIQDSPVTETLDDFKWSNIVEEPEQKSQKSWAEMIDDGGDDIVVEHKSWKEIVEDEVEIPLLAENGDEANINKIIETIQEMKSDGSPEITSKEEEPVPAQITSITDSFTNEDVKTTVAVTKQTSVTQSVTESVLSEQPRLAAPEKKPAVEQEKIPEEPKKPSYAGLPVDKSNSSWMDVLDEPMVFSDEEEKPVVPVKVTETVVEIEIPKSVEPEIVTESSLAEDTTTTVTVTTTTVTETVSESALPEQPKAVVLEKKPEEPKKPAYAGLPVDDSSSSWMDVLDEPMVFSDEEEEPVVPVKVTETVVEKEIVKSVEPEIVTESSLAEDTTTTVTVTTTTVTETVSESALPEQPKAVVLEKKPEEPKKPAYAGLPVDDSSSSWMDVLDEPMVFSDEEEEPVVPEKVTETVVEKEIVKSVEPEIFTESSPAEGTTTTVTVTTTTVTETVSESALPEQPKAVKPEQKPEEPKKPVYAGLPVDVSSSSWMDVLDEPMVFSDEEEEPVVPVKVTETVVEKEIVKSVEPEIVTESSIAEDTTTTVTVTTTTVTETVSESALTEQPKAVKPEEPKKPAYAGLPVDESSSSWMDVLDEPMVFSDEEEEPVVPVKVTETVVEKEIVKSVEPEIVTESSLAEDTTTTVTVTTTTVTETVSESALPEQPKAVVLEKKPEEPKKPAYAGLPVDDSSSSWMDVLDEPMVFSDEEEEPVVPVKVTETVFEKEIVKSVEPEKVTESSLAEDTTKTVTVTTTTVTETVSESALPEQPKAVVLEKNPEEPKKPAYAGLPVDDSSSSWMDVLDEPMVFSDEEEEPVVPVKVTEIVVEKRDQDTSKTVTVTTTTVTETVGESALPEQPKAVILEKKPEEPTKPAYAGLPVDDSSSSWMDVLDEPMVFSDEEEEPVVPVKVTETVFEKEIVKSVEPEKVTESSLAEDTTKTVTVTTTVTEIVGESALSEQPKAVEPEKKPEEPKKSAYAGLPVDESSSSWMDVLDEPMVFSDEEEEPVPVIVTEPVVEKETVKSVEPEIVTESSIAEDAKTTVTVATTTVTETVSETSLPVKSKATDTKNHEEAKNDEKPKVTEPKLPKKPEDTKETTTTVFTSTTTTESAKIPQMQTNVWELNSSYADVLKHTMNFIDGEKKNVERIMEISPTQLTPDIQTKNVVETVSKKSKTKKDKKQKRLGTENEAKTERKIIVKPREEEF
ncbi:hypothetical protein ACLKA6_019312 [Drosophila palustris]